MGEQRIKPNYRRRVSRIPEDRRCSTASARRPRAAFTNAPPIKSSRGTALSSDWLRTGSQWFATGCTWNQGAGRQCHQPATRARSQARTRKRRLRFAESRISCGDQPSERSQATRVSLWQLVERRAKLRSDQNALVRTACVPNETTPWLAVLFGCGFRRQDDEYCYRLVQVCTPVHPGPNWW